MKKIYDQKNFNLRTRLLQSPHQRKPANPAVFSRPSHLLHQQSAYYTQLNISLLRKVSNLTPVNEEDQRLEEF